MFKKNENKTAIISNNTTLTQQNEATVSEVPTNILETDDELYEAGSEWLTIPFADRSILTSLYEKFIPAEGPPNMVIFNADTGYIYNRGALSQMLANPSGFPWESIHPVDVLMGSNKTTTNLNQTQKTSMMNDDSDDMMNMTNALSEHVIGCSAIYPKGNVVKTVKEAVNGSRYVGLFFSADWCAPCKMFLPLLNQTYNMVNARFKEGEGSNNKVFEMFYVSLDRSESNFTAYRNTMPWPAITYQGSKRTELEQALGIRTLPSVVIFDTLTRTIVCKDARNEIMRDPTAAHFPWSSENGVVVLAPPPLPPVKKKASLSFPKLSQDDTFDKEEDDDEYIADDDENDDSKTKTDRSTDMSSPVPPATGGPSVSPPPKGLVDGTALIMFTDKTNQVHSKEKKIAESILYKIAKKYKKQVIKNHECLFITNTKQNEKYHNNNESNNDITIENQSTEGELTTDIDRMAFISKYQLSFFLAKEKTPILNAIRVLIGDLSDIESESEDTQSSQQEMDKKKKQSLFSDLEENDKTNNKETTDKQQQEQQQQSNVSPYAIILDVPNRRFYTSKDVSPEMMQSRHNVEDEGDGVGLSEAKLEKFIHDVLNGSIQAKPLAVNLDGGGNSASEK
eukprot:CAMPEP_0114333192 /NCGR_PEP_ID=MMETSP0101-20121206/3599_1 /TAXON_ID=38822 ORGANISM="Pteridomonas danica, Strain PT" /NCGR_SAMPLE_ID=MMETSP0101 /ASSEMBLY_ACC=CAM_ASM_000211 /LENGTH=621 /DNA_ID=CAMNT_0001464145 /DNA_START=1040 /DNA_END=2905 /DNA_ORIENTATION=-